MNKAISTLTDSQKGPRARLGLGILLAIFPWFLHAADQGDSARISALLAQARQALAENRLTIPSGHNAVGYAQQVLDLVPGHPQAQEMLRDVVARYSALGEDAVDRSKALRERELRKAQAFQERGVRIAKGYRLPDRPLQRLQERLAAEQTRDAVQVAGTQASGREALVGVAARYVTLSEAALKKGDVAIAQQYRQLVQDLVATYSLPDTGLRQLDTKLAEAQAPRLAKAPVTIRPEAATPVTPSPKPAKSGAIFLPPSF